MVKNSCSHLRLHYHQIRHLHRLLDPQPNFGFRYPVHHHSFRRSHHRLNNNMITNGKEKLNSIFFFYYTNQLIRIVPVPDSSSTSDPLCASLFCWFSSISLSCDAVSPVAVGKISAKADTALPLFAV